jgi:hypothetical protein
MSLLRSLFFSIPLIAISTIVMDLISMVFSFFDRSGDSATTWRACGARCCWP